jgi:hypothetical protein
MSLPPPDLRDSTIDGPGGLPSSPKKPQEGHQATLWMLGVIAFSALLWGAFSLYLFVRTEMSLPHPPTERKLFSKNIDVYHFNMIRIGASRAEVEAILGGPPGFYNGVGSFVFAQPSRLFGRTKEGYPTWSDRKACIIVQFSQDGTVVDKEFCLAN